MDIQDIIPNYNKLKKYSIELGVITLNSKRMTFKVGINNAQLMFIHEHGSPLKNIPARPVLQMTIDYANANLLDVALDKAVTAYLDSDFNILEYEKELKKLCIRIENYARKLIYSNDGRLISNAPSTIAKKGDNHPLFDTGQLARSITCRLVSD